MVIEAIFENADAKRALYAELEPQAQAERRPRHQYLQHQDRDPAREAAAIRAAWSASISSIPWRKCSWWKSCRGAARSRRVVQGALQFTRKLDKLPLPCKSAPGLRRQPHSDALCQRGAVRAGKRHPRRASSTGPGTRFGMPMGPIELTDVVGLDVSLHVGRVLAEAFQRRVPDILVKLVEQKKLGRKSGEGFYVWRDGKPVSARTRKSPMPADLEDRLILPMLNEAVACLREGVVEDADLAGCRGHICDRLRAFSRRPAAICPDRAASRTSPLRLTELAAALWRALSAGPGLAAVLCP